MPGMSDTDSFAERARYLKRYEVLKAERQPWIPLWRDLSANFSPTSSSFDDDRVRHVVKKNRLLNNTPIRDGLILAAGMMTSITSPARKWFKLSKPYSYMVDEPDVRAWLEDVENALFQIFARSNLYTALSAAYCECAIYGTSVFFVDEDEEDVVRAYVLPVGTYCLSASCRRRVDTLYRDVWLSTAQMAERFGLDACSQHVRNLWSNGDRDTLHKVLHVIEPDESYVRGSGDYRSKAFRSVWLEVGGEATGVLKRSGYHEFPVMAPRWSVNDAQAYGIDSPGMVALGDAKTLQKVEADALKIIENGATPALLASSAVRNQQISMRPAEVTYGDSANGAPIAAPLYQNPPHWVSILDNKAKAIESRISQAFFADLFLSLLESDRRQITAEEIRARQQEKMLQLGPVLERLNDELLDPLIDRVFAVAYRRGLLPRAPEGLDGQSIRVEYLSVLTQAQKAVGVSSVQNFVSSVLQLAQARPDVMDKVSWDVVVDDLAEMFGVPPRELASEDAIRAVREGRAAAEAQARALDAQTQQAEQVRALSQAKTDSPSALTELLGAVSGPMGEAQA